jgi:inner membrane transporter RhtA
MNLLIYQAFARIPIGIAIAIEILGPLGVVLASARRVIDFVWFILALVGLSLFLPLQTHDAALDGVGILFAIGAAIAWACYILVGKKLSTDSTLNTVAIGMFIAACVAAPFGIIEAGSALFSPSILFMGLMVALFSSALPFPLEMIALKRLPTHIFSIIVSASPVIAAIPSPIKNLIALFIASNVLVGIIWKNAYLSGSLTLFPIRFLNLKS